MRRLWGALWKLRQGKYGPLVLGALWAMVLLIIAFEVCLALGWFVPHLYIFSIEFVLLFQVAILYVVGRVAGRVADLQASVSMEYGLQRAGYQVTDFFTDEAAAPPTLQLFVLKVLLFCHPKKVLEIGTGQTTKLLSNYSQKNPDTDVLSIEQDESWANRVGPQVGHSYRHVPLETVSFTRADTGKVMSTTWYRDIPEFTSAPFQFILVDGPDYQPIDSSFYRAGILRYLPTILDKSFVMVFDDAERLGDSMTVGAVDDLLRAKKIDFYRFSIHGSRTTAVFCSPDLEFLSTV